MPDQTISTNWTNQSLPNLEQSGGSGQAESILDCPSVPSLNGALWESFDPAIQVGSLSSTLVSGTLYGVAFGVTDPTTTKGMNVYIGAAGTATLSGCVVVDLTTGNIVLAGSGTSFTATSLNPYYWSGDADSDAVGVTLREGAYYAGFWSVFTGSPTFLTQATALSSYANLGTAAPASLPAPAGTPPLRFAVLKTSLSAAPVSATTLVTSASVTNAFVPYLQLF